MVSLVYFSYLRSTTALYSLGFSYGSYQGLFCGFGVACPCKHFAYRFSNAGAAKVSFI